MVYVADHCLLFLNRQTLVGEVHRRILVEYVRAIMRGRIICTSSKMRKRMAFRLQDEAKQLKGLFRDLVSLMCTHKTTRVRFGRNALARGSIHDQRKVYVFGDKKC